MWHVKWFFSPPVRPGSAVYHPPAPPWPTEAHPSSGVTIQSTAETQTVSNMEAKWLINKHVYSCKVSSHVCVCMRSQRTSTLTWLSELQEIWVTELLEVGQKYRNINKLLKDGVKHLQFVLCTDRQIFHRHCSKTPTAVCRGVWTLCKLTTVEYCFHVKTLRQEQIGLPFEGLRGK